MQVGKQTKAAVDAQHALASKDRARLDAVVSQRVAEADALRYATLPAKQHEEAAHGQGNEATECCRGL